MLKINQYLKESKNITTQLTKIITNESEGVSNLQKDKQNKLKIR